MTRTFSGSNPLGAVMKNYEVFTGNDLIVADKILRDRLRLLVHSKIYYDFDHNLISDKDWDAMAKELVVLQRDYPDISSQVDWYDAFKDWDASTGAFLPLNDPWVVMKATQISKRTPQIKKSVKTKEPAAKVGTVKRLF